MAVNLLGSNNAAIDFGDIAALAGLTQITVSITFKASALTGGRIVHQWSNLTAGQSFIIQTTATDELGFIVSQGDSNRCGRQTTDLNISTGTTYRAVGRWKASPKTIQIWVDGTNRTVTTLSADVDLTVLANSSTSVRAGRESEENIDGIDADYSEFAIHAAYMPDDYCIAYGKGYSPAFYRKNGLFYAPIINVSNLVDLWSGKTGTNSSGTSAPHPRIIMPRPKKTQHGAVTVFYMRPDADDADGTWTTETGGTTLFASIDEPAVDDADYIQSAQTPQNDICRVRISDPTATPAEPFNVRYRYKKLGADTVDLVVRLKEGTTTRATWTHSNVGATFTTVTQTLSAGEFATITDFTNLFVEFEADTP